MATNDDLMVEFSGWDLKRLAERTSVTELRIAGEDVSALDRAMKT